jgi:hypothetical protein
MDDQMECYLAIFVETYYPSAGHTSEGIVVEAAWLQYQGDFGVQKGVHGLYLDACEAEDDVNEVWNDEKLLLKYLHHRAESCTGAASKELQMNYPCSSGSF